MRVTVRLPRSLVAALATVIAGVTTPAAASAAPLEWPLPRLELGATSQPGTASTLAKAYKLKLRYQYLAGGVNTDAVWTTWGDRFVESYVEESRKAKMLPVFTYYEIRQSLPGGNNGDEPKAVLSNLENTATMRAYWQNVRELFTRLGKEGGPAVVHVEPDMWGYLQQAYGDDATKAPVSVASSGASDVAGLPNTAAGFAQAFVRLRDQLAPQVRLGYHVSIWGTNRDIVITNDSLSATRQLAARAAAFQRSLGAAFDVRFGEMSDKDSGLAVAWGAPRSTAWWNAADFRRHAAFYAAMRQASPMPLVLWQIPVGNTVMRSVNDTTGHYQDNKVQWLLDARKRWVHLRAYRDAGLVSLLFGGGQGDDTSVLDARNDGATNPSPINGNRRRARVADDDGGYFRERARAYARRGTLKLSP
ncbi:MAG: hypothetical protein J7513_12740 [Solirubrobacteraceae bacterium]|nr:hypothetical protein [Solirubrobacteraceae bacterium]